ncbi:hypothetical protein PoB_000548300 [Plakobranchus ocellatus]|uniref:Uncharacterized protein n=1 Tax=Plakobranchus ocellatus TaxID=259542 RepID=A0AAV3Y8Z4_9GAST|nr:hypothetical protein PoB_000548300 [Plakobranchus ocellatus]
MSELDINAKYLDLGARLGRSGEDLAAWVEDKLRWRKLSSKRIGWDIRVRREEYLKQEFKLLAKRQERKEKAEAERQAREKNEEAEVRQEKRRKKLIAIKGWSWRS